VGHEGRTEAGPLIEVSSFSIKKQKQPDKQTLARKRKPLETKLRAQLVNDKGLLRYPTASSQREEDIMLM
jgi:hypothetical protein